MFLAEGLIGIGDGAGAGVVGEGGEGEGEDCRLGELGEAGSAGAGGEEGFEDEDDDGEGERPLKAFDGNALEIFGVLSGVHLIEAKGVDLFESAAGGAEGGVEPVGGGGDAAEGGFVEGGLDGIAGGVAEEVTLSIGVGDGDEFAVGGADADGEDTDPFIGGFAGAGDALGFEVFAIGNENEDTGILGLFEVGDGLIDGGGDIGSLTGDGVGIDRVEGVSEGLIIESEGALEEGASGEGDQTDAIALHLAEKVEDSELGAFEPIGGDILGEHTAGRIEGEKDIDAGALGFFPTDAPLGAGEGEEEEGEGEEEEAMFNPEAAAAVAGEEATGEGGIDETLEAGSGGAFTPEQEEGARDEEEREGEEEERLVKSRHDQGIRRYRVSRRIKSRRRTARPRARGMAKTSV